MIGLSHSPEVTALVEKTRAFTRDMVLPLEDENHGDITAAGGDTLRVELQTVLPMGTTFHGPSPWPHITRAIRVRGPRHAAIAYLGEDAPTLLPLRAGDLLVVNRHRTCTQA